MKLYLLEILLISEALFWSRTLSKVGLNPRGNESVCPNSNISRILICNITTTILMWDISIQRGSAESTFFTYGYGDSNSPFETRGVSMRIIAGSSTGISSQLVIPNMRNLLPIEVRCSDLETPNGQTYLLRNKEPPDPPTGITLERNSAANTNHIIHWTSNSDQMLKSVDNYIVTVTNIRLASLPQRYIASMARIPIQLNYNTNYAVTVIAMNCAGQSTPYSANILTEEMPVITTLPITTPKPVTQPHSLISSSEVISTAITVKERSSTNEEMEDLSSFSTHSTTTPQAVSQEFTPWLVGVITLALLCGIFNIISFVVGFLCRWKCFSKSSSSNKYSVSRFNNEPVPYIARNAAKNDQFMV